jgi:hypothetical protein
MQGYRRKNHRRARRQTRGVKTLISPPSLHKVPLYLAVYDHGYCFRALMVVIGPSFECGELRMPARFISSNTIMPEKFAI